ncbi:MAG: hypothetical protein ABIH76_00065 [Candidatus Bathyarchaeota archaeon]
MFEKIESARNKYKPKKIKYLLVAEAPPKIESNRFFYFENIRRGDSLFLETMKVVYPKQFIDVKYVRDKKTTFLEQFKRDGFYLIDSVDHPINGTSSQKKKEIQKNLPQLSEKIVKLANEETKVILISATVYEVCYDYLKKKGINVSNIEMIDFPGSGGQKKYREKIEKILAQ